MSVVKKNIAILGSTGSIGRNSLEVISNLSDQFTVTYLTTNKSIELLKKQIEVFRPSGVVVTDIAEANKLRYLVDENVEVLEGEKGLEEIVTRDNVDIVISSLVGFAGLKPTIKAIQHRKGVALANKETLVVAGEIIMSLVDKYRVKLLPVDSEHSAILQCLEGESRDAISKLVLTASGGPFFTLTREDLASVSVESALNHPNWKMGDKITIDSATMMNKGLEVIEAHWLFGLPREHIEVLIHPQSIIHSMVEFVDGSIKAQLGIPDMKIPIQYALTYPKRMPLNTERLNLAELKNLTFFKPDEKKFRCLGLAFDTLKVGGVAPTAMNAANEVAVDAFLNRKITFDKIPEYIERAVEKHNKQSHPELEHIFETDRYTRKYVQTLIYG